MGRGGAPEFQLTPREPNRPVAVDPREDITVTKHVHHNTIFQQKIYVCMHSRKSTVCETKELG